MSHCLSEKAIAQDHSARQNAHILFPSFLKVWTSDGGCHFLRRDYVSDISEKPEDDPKYLKEAQTPSYSLWAEEQSILDEQKPNVSFPWHTAHTKLIPAHKVSLLSHSCY